jgi:hypothetical protein
MSQKIRTELRNASEKEERDSVKDLLELGEFLKEWRIQLKRKGKAWEGPRAVDELQKKKIFEFLLGEKGSSIEWQVEDLFLPILAEMKAYREEAEHKLVREYFKDTDEFLNGLRMKIQKREENEGNLRELKSLLEDLRKKVEGTQRAVDLLKKRKANWHFGMWRQLWPEIPRRNIVSRKIELDTRLQVELGKIFAGYLGREGVSLETIARLILLAYSAGRLSGMDGDDTRTILTNRVLNVRNIRDNLTEAGLQNAASFKRRSR